MSYQVKNILFLLICLSTLTSINSKLLRKFHKAPHMPVNIDQEYFKECLTFPGATERICQGQATNLDDVNDCIWAYGEEHTEFCKENWGEQWNCKDDKELLNKCEAIPGIDFKGWSASENCCKGKSSKRK